MMNEDSYENSKAKLLNQLSQHKKVASYYQYQAGDVQITG